MRMDAQGASLFQAVLAGGGEEDGTQGTAAVLPMAQQMVVSARCASPARPPPRPRPQMA